MQSRIWYILTLLWIALACAPTAAPAQILPALTPEQAESWSAIGVVNIQGREGPAICSGTLIAPNLVLTAAHCAQGGNRQFLIGGIGTQMRAGYQSINATLHPEYESTTGADRFNVDLAILTLTTPVPASIATPLVLADADAANSYAMIGFHRMRPAALNGRFDCVPAFDAPEEQFILDCQVIAGNSGAPVLVETAVGWQIVGVVTARKDGSGRRLALVAPVDTWVRGWVAKRGSSD